MHHFTGSTGSPLGGVKSPKLYLVGSIPTLPANIKSAARVAGRS